MICHMKGSLQLKESQTNKSGEVGIVIIILTTTILVFIVLPIFAFIFDKALVNLVSQDIVDEVELLTKKVYPSLLCNDLSEKKILLSNDLAEIMNQRLDELKINPMIDDIEIDNIDIEYDVYFYINFSIKLSLKPSLYRKILKVPRSYSIFYTVELPLDN